MADCAAGYPDSRPLPCRRDHAGGCACGPWERRARRAGAEILTLDGLRWPRLTTHAGCPPLFRLPAWACGAPLRDLAIGYLCAELGLRLAGEDHVAAALAGRAVPAREPAGPPRAVIDAQGWITPAWDEAGWAADS